ncbi:MAG: cytochrome c [Bacteroidota bacterium]
MIRFVNIVMLLGFLCSGFSLVMVTKGFLTAQSEESYGFCGVVDAHVYDPIAAYPEQEKGQLEEGKHLYRSNCAACHALNAQRVGPPLSGIGKKYQGQEEWLYQWIRNAPELIKEGDPKAVALFEQYQDHGMMQAFPLITDEEITAILGYISAMDKSII